MIIAHAPALWGAFAAVLEGGLLAGKLGNLAALIAVTAFFVGKLLDLPILRFRRDRRTLVANVVAVVLMHSGAIGDRLGAEPVPWEVPAATTTILVAGLDRVRNALEAVVSRGRCGVRRLTTLTSHPDTAADTAFRPTDWILANSPLLPRAPPVTPA